MAISSINKICAALLSASLLFSGCKKWDDHNSISDPALTRSVFDQISTNTSLAKFTDLLKKSGYDKVIASSKTFTVFAPTDAALATLDAGIVNDSARLRAFVGNHIANQSFYTAATAGGIRIPMLNGKYNRITGKTIETATISTADQYARNGVVHVIDKMLPALPNAWEALNSNPAIPAKQKAYILSLFRKVFDATNAVQIGVNPVTGEPVYQPGTDSITTNLFWRNVYDLRDESREFNFLVLNDAAWDSEVAKFSPFFATSTTDSTAELAKWNVLKDLAIEVTPSITPLPDTVLSRFAVKVPVTPAAIVQTIKTSNGNIYIMNKVDVQPRHKLKEFIIQAENYSATNIDRRGNTYFRDRYNAVTGKDFTDVLFFNHGSALFNARYRIREVNSVKYRAYWVAVNDFQATTHTQKLALGSTTSATFGYTTVPVNNYNEVLIGEFTMTSYQSIYDIFLVAANTTVAATNAIVCDYIRLEPVVN